MKTAVRWREKFQGRVVENSPKGRKKQKNFKTVEIDRNMSEVKAGKARSSCIRVSSGVTTLKEGKKRKEKELTLHNWHGSIIKSVPTQKWISHQRRGNRWRTRTRQPEWHLDSHPLVEFVEGMKVKVMIFNNNRYFYNCWDAFLLVSFVINKHSFSRAKVYSNENCSLNKTFYLEIARNN